MQIKVQFKDGQLRIVDTTNFTSNDGALRASKNVATFFNISAKDITKEGLWIDVYATDGGDTYRYGERRICPVTQEYSIQVVSSSEIASILDVSIDGHTLIEAYGEDSWINKARFSAQVARIVNNKENTSTNLQAMQVYEWLLLSAPKDKSEEDKKMWAAEEMGWKLKDIEALYATMKSEVGQIADVESEQEKQTDNTPEDDKPTPKDSQAEDTQAPENSQEDENLEEEFEFEDER